MSFTILGQKDQSNPPRPLVLVSIVALDGDTVRLSTAADQLAQDVTYGGNTYDCRLLDSNIDAIQSMSALGFDQIPAFTLAIADANNSVWGRAQGHGWRGATATLTFVLYDIPTQAYSTDAIQWQFLCEQPTKKGGIISLGATSKVNAQQIKIPSVNISYRCPWSFPATLAQRQDGADNSDSLYYRCGYSPDATGGNACGNYQTGTTAFTGCNLTRQDCIARGMFTVDSSARTTGRFGGSTWVAPQTFVGTQYTTGRTFHTNEPGYNTPNPARYNDVIPWVYGTQWVNARPMAPAAEPNSLRFEAIVCLGDVGSDGILKVECNGHEIPHNGSDVLFTWRYVNTGGRNGAVNNDAIFDSKGDPYGSICAIEVVIPAELGAPGSMPSVRVLVQGPKVRVYTGPTTFTVARTTNPAWHLMDLLVKTGWLYSQLDIQTFIDVATYCNASVTYTNLTGVSTSHERWRSSFALESRLTASQAITMIRRSFGLILHASIEAGLSLYIEQTLADQQGSAVPGSNYTTAVSSVSASGSATNGYLAYLFYESVVDEDSFEYTSEALASTPNQFTLGFQDEDNQWQADSLKQTDTNALPSSGQRELPQALEVLGLCNFDEAGRRFNILLNKAQNGNPRTDHMGSIGFRFTTSMRAVHLATRPGYICAISWQADSLFAQQFRVLSAKPIGTDGRKWEIRGSWHNDNWFVDSGAQVAVPLYNNPFRSQGTGAPIPWKPAAVTTTAADPIFAGASTISLQQGLSNNANGTPANSVTVAGIRPINSLSSISAPFVPVSATATTGTGSIPAGTYVLQVAAIDSSGKYSQGSTLMNATLSATGELIISGISWDSGTSKYDVFVGSSQFTLQSVTGQVSGSPSSISITSLPVANSSYGPPDAAFFRYRFRAKALTQNGSWRKVTAGALRVTAVNTGAKTITVADVTFTTNEWAGRTLALVSAADTTAPSAMFEDLVVSNTGTVLTMTSTPTAVAVGDWVQVFAKATAATSTTITDSKWVNSVNAAGLTANAEAGNLVRIIAGTGIGQTAVIASNTTTAITINGAWNTTPDTTSIFWVESAQWTYDYEGPAAVPVGVLDASAIGIGKVPVDNYLGRSVLIEVLTEDQNGNFAPEYLAPRRAIYVPGAQGTRVVTAATTIIPPDGTVQYDTSGGAITQALPTASQFPNQTISFVKLTSDANALTITGAASGTVAIQNQWQTVSFRSDGTQWILVQLSTGKKYVQTFSSVTSVAVTHNFGTTDLMFTAYLSSGEILDPEDVAFTSGNTVTLTFGTTAISGKVVVMA